MNTKKLLIKSHEIYNVYHSAIHFFILLPSTHHWIKEEYRADHQRLFRFRMFFLCFWSHSRIILSEICLWSITTLKMVILWQWSKCNCFQSLNHINGITILLNSKWWDATICKIMAESLLSQNLCLLLLLMISSIDHKVDVYNIQNQFVWKIYMYVYKYNKLINHNVIILWWCLYII